MRCRAKAVPWPKMGTSKSLLFIAFPCFVLLSTIISQAYVTAPLTTFAPLRYWDKLRYLASVPLALVVRNMGWYRTCLPETNSLKYPQNIAIVAGHTKSYSYVSDCLTRMKLYTARHNYTFYDIHKVFAMEQWQPRNGWFRKVLTVKHTMLLHPQHDWLLWLDSDVWIAKPEMRLEALLPDPTEPGYEDIMMVLAHDDEGVNAGVFFIRNNARGVAFMDEWLSYDQKGVANDQIGLREMYNERVYTHANKTIPPRFAGGAGTPKLPARNFRQLRQCAMNSTPCSGLYNETYMHGDFIVHVFGMKLKTKLFALELLREGKLLAVFA